jgi:hypothetical protein
VTNKFVVLHPSQRKDRKKGELKWNGKGENISEMTQVKENKNNSKLPTD